MKTSQMRFLQQNLYVQNHKSALNGTIQVCKMLIQITNRCHEGCGHCMQCSNPAGGHMSEQTFKNALVFGKFLKSSVFIISGGEPTEHPQFISFCEYLDAFIRKHNLKAMFSVTSNGTWYPEHKDEIAKIAKLKHYAGMQVYTNPKWYRSASFIMANKADIDSIPKVMVTTEDIRSMQDLGRAKGNKQAQHEVAMNHYHMSCLNGHLMFRQTDPLTRLAGLDVRPGLMCKPLVDWQGNVHLSESWLCQSFGNVNEDMMMEIFRNLQQSKPCCKCRLGLKYLSSNAPKIIAARQMMSKNTID